MTPDSVFKISKEDGFGYRLAMTVEKYGSEDLRVSDESNLLLVVFFCDKYHEVLCQRFRCEGKISIQTSFHFCSRNIYLK